MYNIYDRYGVLVRGSFKSWRDAQMYICVMMRFDWEIRKI